MESKLHLGFMYLCAYCVVSMDSNSTSNEFDALSDSIQRIVSHFPHSEIFVTGDFNVHNSLWLRYSGQTTSEERYVEIFAELNHLIQLVDEPTRIPDVAGQSATLDLFLTSDPNKYAVIVLSPLGTSDHCVISANFSCQKTVVKEKTPTRTVWQYEKANLNGLNDFFRNFNWSLYFLDSRADSRQIWLQT